MPHIEACSAGRLIAVIPTSLTWRAELLLLCARIGYSPPEGR